MYFKHFLSKNHSEFKSTCQINLIILFNNLIYLKTYLKKLNRSVDSFIAHKHCSKTSQLFMFKQIYNTTNENIFLNSHLSVLMLFRSLSPSRQFEEQARETRRKKEAEVSEKRRNTFCLCSYKCPHLTTPIAASICSLTLPIPLTLFE